eukprot:TRINITY_DN1033_c0_g1_i1.p1 TRINITY_DN1033_c0_g1~~TRINITY_DN1033_c0_g1_i1.p1  ORF type:complete len:311 (+),score=131.27 TRINITY_DN1033_c0_g1_i1:1-933(+)
MFVQSSNGQHSVGGGRETWIPRATATSPKQLAMFEFFGQLIGVVIRTGNQLNMDLSSTFYKFLVGERANLSDLRSVDLMCVQSLHALRTIDQQGVTAETFGDVFTETFTTNATDGGEAELVAHGAQRRVTVDNRLRFAALVERYRLREAWPQLAAVRRGLGSVVSLATLSLLTWRELKLRVEGSAEIDLALLRRNTVYRGGYDARHRVVQLFWRVLESFSDAERALFLRFAWGRARLPPNDAAFTQKLKLSLLDCANPDEHLALSHTCFFDLELPPYSSFEIMRRKLLYAITQCVAMDSDFTVTNAGAWE